jgi:hypothetical protein
MSAVEWYYARENKQTGPVSSLELKRLAAAGELRPADLVWREGMTEWSLASNVSGLFDGEAKPADSGLKIGEPAVAAPVIAPPAAAAARPAPAAPQAPRRHLFDVLLDWLRRRFDKQFIDSTARVFRACGSYGLLAAMVLAAVFAVVMAVTDKTAHFERLLSGAGAIVVLAALQYVAGKSCEIIDQFDGMTESSISSGMLTDCLALLSMVAGLGTLVLALAGVVGNLANLIRVPFGLAAFVVGCYLAAVLLNPSALGVSIARMSRVSEVAMGLLTFVLKALLRSVSVMFGAGVICSALLLAYSCGEVFSGDKGVELAENTAMVAGRCFCWFGTLPLIACIAFLACCLLIDLCRAILSLPAKPDKPAPSDEK